MRKRILSVFLFMFSLVLLGRACEVAALADETRILEGVYAENIPLGGMSEDEARRAIESVVSELSGRSITLYTVNDEEIMIHPSDVGFCWSNPEIIDEAVKLGHIGNIVQRYKSKKDLSYANRIFPIEYSVDSEKINDVLYNQCAVYDQQAMDGLIERVDDKFVVNAGQMGAVLDVEKSAVDLQNFLCSEWTGENSAFQLTVKVDDPEGTYEQLSLVKDVLGSFHTDFKSSGSNRSANVRNGARLINGNVVYPGEEYSFYDHIKPFTTDNGYYIGAAYSGGRVVDSIGGGICQVSSTLYNAVLYSELEVTARKNHAMIVGYVDPARDATISEASGIDFKFRNNTDAPIYIDAYTTDDKQLYITLYGHETRPAGRTVEYESEILSRTVPDTENIFTDYSLPVGSIEVQSVHVGYKANLWKMVTENGETTKELINTSSYNPTPKYAIVGMATTDPTILSLMEQAVASGSIDTVKACIANCKTYQNEAESQAAALAAYQAALEAQNNAPVPEEPAPDEN